MSKLAKALTAAAGNAGGDNLYVEDVFSTYLYEGDGSTRTITNDIDLDGEGGLVWLKDRSQAQSNYLFDTENGANKFLISDLTAAISTVTNRGVTAFNSNGFDLGASAGGNRSGDNFASWTFRKAEKFFDVVTYTGDGANGREIPHSLAGDVGMVIVKCTSDSDQWLVWHKSTPTGYLRLDGTGALVTSFAQFKFGNGTTTVNPTSSVFTVAGDSDINGSGRTYVAYLFASDAGGFGDDGDESIIKCGSYTGTGSAGNEVNLGFEPQWILIKGATSGAAYDWYLVDNMRGITTGGNDPLLWPNKSDAEDTASNIVSVTATGFKLEGTGFGFNRSGETYIYIAIRRPMKTPESGTEVFKANYVDNGASFPDMLSGFPVDMYFRRYVNTTNNPYWFTRLLGTNVLDSTTTGAEQSFSANSTAMDSNVGVMNIFSTNNTDFYGWMFKRATGFFDVVAYTGDGTLPQNIAHNLGVIPELMIVRSRNLARNWATYNSYSGATQYMNLNTDAISNTSSFRWYNTEPTSTVFSVGGTSNTSGDTYIAYLFATLAGVSKVGSYTGTGSNVDVDCGFSAGARFILIKRTDSTGDWYVWDSARGIVAGNDPYLLLNTTAAEVTNTDYIDPLNAGFTVTSSAPAALNASGGTYIFLAIA